MTTAVVTSPARDRRHPGLVRSNGRRREAGPPSGSGPVKRQAGGPAGDAGRDAIRRRIRAGFGGGT
jgi:hypothetical protein